MDKEELKLEKKTEEPEEKMVTIVIPKDKTNKDFKTVTVGIDYTTYVIKLGVPVKVPFEVYRNLVKARYIDEMENYPVD